MKILFISPRPFGLMGTPGTYHLVEAYARHAEVCVIANATSDGKFAIVHAASSALTLHEVPFETDTYLDEIAKIARDFDPDIVCMANYFRWYSVVERVRRELPDAKFVLDIKSPCVTERMRVRDMGAKMAPLLDLILSRCVEDVETWIPGCSRPVQIYPLGLSLPQFSPRKPEGEVVRCRRFVFIGSYAPQRALDALLRQIAALPSHLKEQVSFDLFGSGPSKEELLSLAGELGLSGIVKINDALPQGELFALLPGYDAGIAWVPQKTFDAAPSLKMLEYMAAGLVPMASATTAHRRNVGEGYKAVLFDESPGSFAQAVERLAAEGFPAKAVENNLEIIKARDWDNVVRQNLLPVFQNLIEGGIPAGSACEVAAPAPRKKKILFISPRPFGRMGTPGTYHLAEAYSRHAEIRVVANAIEDGKLSAVHKVSAALDLVEISFDTADYVDNIAKIARDFDPDVVTIVNYYDWFSLVERLKVDLPRTKFVLDLKSPYLRGRESVKSLGAKKALLLDLVLTLCPENVETWIPGCKRPVRVYPLGISLPQFAPRRPEGDVVRCRRFVFIGSYAKERELDILLRYIAALPQSLKGQVRFDLFGSGPAKEELALIVEELALADIVTINDALSQEELFARLPGYDAGIAWVPRKVFDASPSLKMIEYIAAGLVPMASATTAHRRNVGEGFASILFDENPRSFAQAIQGLVVDGFPAKAVEKNLELIKSRDYDEIVKSHMLPAFESLFSAATQFPEGAAPPQTDDVFDRMLFWSPAIPVAQITPPPPSPLRIAAILGPRLFDGLVDEVRLAVLTPQSWFYALRFGQPDMLLVESTFSTCTGDWHMAQSVPGNARDELSEIVSFARKQGIPTVFWMTADSAYAPHFAEFAREFDFVFCADERAVEVPALQSVGARYLPPAIQPRRFNPIAAMTGTPTFGIVYDGWTDIYKKADVRDLLQRIGPEYLSIIESGAMIPRSHVARVQDSKLRGAIKGSVHASLLPLIYKHARASISFSQSSISPTEAAWRALEVAASRVPLAHRGTLAEGDFRSRFVNSFDRDEDFIDFVGELRSDPIKRDKAAHRAWRFAHETNAFADRIAEICAVAGIRHERRSLPKAVVVTATMRAQLLEKSVRQFLAQTYPNKHLVIVFNGDASELESVKNAHGSRDDITFTTMPTDFQAGCSLNYGAKLVAGDYFFRVDDDDHYGDNYIADCMLHLRACDADVFGKRASFLHFEGDDKVFLRKKLLPDISGFAARDLQSNQETWISGCSFACKLDLLRDVRYPDSVNFAADTELVSRIRAFRPDAQCLLLDNLNLVVERSADVTSHTWQSTAKQLQSGSETLALEIADLMV